MATNRDMAKGGDKSLIPWDDDNPFLSLRKQMDEAFDEFWRGFPSFGLLKQTGKGAFSPRLDVTDTEDALRIAAEVPGMDEKDIDVTLTKDALTIKGEKKEEREEKTHDYYRMERSYGSFVRSVPLPAEIDAAKVQASLKKGVLTITLPKTAKAIKEAKKIAVKGE